MPPSQVLRSRKRQVFALRVLILVGFILASLFLVIRLISEIYYEKATYHLRESYYLPAVKDLEKALFLRPDFQAALRKLGDAYGKLADIYPTDKAFDMARKSKQACSKAFMLNPLDQSSAFCRALSETQLEYLYGRQHPQTKENPYDPLPYFEQAINLRPNSISTRYALASYFYKKKRFDELPPVIRALVRINPSIYPQLKKEAFWSPALKEAAKNGLKQAIEEGTDLRNAHSILSRILEEEKDWPGAISHLRKASMHQSFFNFSSLYSHLGRLYLKNRQTNAAEEAFIEALQRSDNPEKDLKYYFSEFNKMGLGKELPGFYEKVKERFSVSNQMDVLLAESLSKAGMLDQAKHILNETNRMQPIAEAWYWLARIGDQEKNLPVARNAIEQALILDPQNIDYHLYFSRLLLKMNKLMEAEKEAGLAIKYAAGPSPVLFAHRGEIRLNLGNHLGAAEDMVSAAALDSTNTGYLIKAGHAYERAGRFNEAEAYYEKAASQNPGDEGYRENLSSFRKRHAKKN